MDLKRSKNPYVQALFGEYPKTSKILKNTGFPGPWATVVKFVAGLYPELSKESLGKGSFGVVQKIGRKGTNEARHAKRLCGISEHRSRDPPSNKLQPIGRTYRS